jgi:hypothetical protein
MNAGLDSGCANLASRYLGIGRILTDPPYAVCGATGLDTDYKANLYRRAALLLKVLTRDE